MRMMSGLQQFTGDGNTAVFPVTIPAQPDTNYVVTAEIEYVSGPFASELDSHHVSNKNVGNFRVVFANPPEPTCVFNVNWILTDIST